MIAKHLMPVANNATSMKADNYQSPIFCADSADVKWRTGAFKLALSKKWNSNISQDTAIVNLTVGTGSSTVSATFEENAAQPIPNTGFYYDYILVFEAQAQKVTVYRALVDSTGITQTTIVKCGETILDYSLRMYAIAYVPSSDYLRGVDLYNHAMVQQDIEDIYNS
jgi:hypothetical protein